MWEVSGMENEDFLWAGIPFMGGIAGQSQAPCGAVSAAAVFLGLKHRCSLSDKEKAKAARNQSRAEASEYVRYFEERFGSITCKDLIGVDFSDPEAVRQWRTSGITKETCEKFVTHTVEWLFNVK